MLKRQLVFNILGIALDVLKPEVNSKFAYSIKNMRLTATKDSNLLSLTTEKGTLGLSTVEFINETTHSSVTSLVGKFLGACILLDNLILFTKDDTNGAVNPDRIYRLFFHDYGSGDTDISLNRISYNLLYRGNINFSLLNPIEAIASYENEKSLKVYWVDGLNQPRVINILENYIELGINYNTTNYSYDPFCFTLEINFDTDANLIQVSKQFYGGVFNAGVVLYAYCYLKSNMLETNIVEFTPLYYVSFSNRGEESGKQVSCSFNISITSNEEDISHFDYIRVFQIYSSSLNALPNVKIIKDIDVSVLTNDNNFTYSFVDSNEFLIDASEQELQIIKLFIIPQTIVSKDNTLFFGNFKSNFVVDKTDLSNLNSKPVFTVDNTRLLKIDDGTKYLNVYKYKNLLDKSSRDIKTFKYGEHYKFGVLFQNKYGQWSEPYFIADVTNTEHPENYYSTLGTCRIPYAWMPLTDIYDAIMNGTNDEEKQYVKARPVISFPTLSERLVLCQGVINPTVFNLTERCNGTTYSLASWFFRPYPNPYFEDNSSYKELGPNGWYEKGATCQFKHMNPLFPSDNIGGELLNMYFDTLDVSGTGTTVGDLIASIIGKMWTIESGLKAEFLQLARDHWGSGINLQTDWYVNTHHTWSFTSLNGYSYGISADVLESRWDSTDPTIGYLKLEVRVFTYTSPLFPERSRRGRGYVNGAEDALRPWKSACDLGSVLSATSIYQNYYYVDQSVATLNSPEIEFDPDVLNADLTQYLVRIVGYIPLTTNSGNYRISASSPLFKMTWYTSDGYVRGTAVPTGHYKRLWQEHQEYILYSGHTMLASLGCWFDDINGIFNYDGANNTGWNDNAYEKQYFVHPWLRQYLNNYNHGTINSSGLVDSLFTIEDIESSKIYSKILANIRFSENTEFLSVACDVGASTPQIFNYDLLISLKLTNDKFYQGNVDLLLVTSSQFFGSGFTGDANHGLPVFSNGIALLGYPIIVGDAYNQSNAISLGTLVDCYSPRALCGTYGEFNYTPNESSMDPILLRYRSSPHIVFGLEQTSYQSGNNTIYQLNILPIGAYSGVTPGFAWDNAVDWASGEALVWNSDNFSEVVLLVVPIDTDRGYLWLGELYRDIKSGSSDPFENNNDAFSLRLREWVVAGESVDFFSTSLLHWYEGDTFYQRYDCLKTYPFSDEDYLSVVEILSFMCETRVNLDGRYDKNRGLLDNTLVNGTNFNLLNPVYNQENNFYTYNILDADIFNANLFANQLTWTLPKLNGAKIDNWTKITLAATADADGSKGEIRALRKYNNDIYCFLDRGVGRILYDERVQISTSDGTPIEIGNSLKFQGIRYISDIIGCLNKWACKETPSGIYFVDNNTPGIYQIAEADKEGSIKPTNITREKYMQSWFETKNVGYFGSWNPSTPTNCWINYDASVDEVLITDPHDCLAYSPQLKFFTGFYSYNGVPYITTLGKYPLAIKNDSTLYRLREGNYSQFFNDRYQTFGLTITAYPYDERSFVRDCIYDNLWYKADEFTSAGIYLPNQSFDSLRAWNEYLNSDVNSGLSYDNQTSNHSNTNLRKKFRMWYARIPRNYSATTSHTDRMRNPWLRLGLYKNSPTGNVLKLLELMVDCFY